jgi:hypothetical protein
MSVMHRDRPETSRPLAPPDPVFEAHMARAKLHLERAREHRARAERFAEEAERWRQAQRRPRGLFIGWL